MARKGSGHNNRGNMKRKKKGESIIQVTTVTKKKKKKKLPKIFLITSMHFGYKYYNKKRSPDGIYHSYRVRTSKNQKRVFTILERRTWGWFTNFKTAEQSVLENWGDICEGNLTYAVIEEVEEGTVVTPTLSEHWYKWRGPWPMTEDGKIGGYQPIKNKPKQYSNVVKFWG